MMEYKGETATLPDTWHGVQETIDGLVEDKLLAVSAKICTYKRMHLNLEEKEEEALFEQLDVLICTHMKH